MIKFIGALVLLASAVGAVAQPQVRLNHIALHVQNLKASRNFYEKIIGLDTIPEPFHDGKHTWFEVGPKSHLHLIEGAQAKVTLSKDIHLCFSVLSVDAFVEKLKRNNIAFEDWGGSKSTITRRVDGVKQIYFKDPDGYWIEINDARE
ncbi:MAG: VOC family protein [Cyclobacteriaceae bacterium]|nr:VOC family protein [Cytophagales bacterium]MBX2899336.1 VOC family protein [Cyclobacteriaceae bacterium]